VKFNSISINSKTRLILIVILFALCTPGFSGIQRKEIKAIRTSQAPVIDANLNDRVWDEAEIATEFIQQEPYNGKTSTQKTEVRVLYDDNAIYFGVRLYDTAPDSIIANISKRDEDPSADFFGFFIDPFNDGINSFAFFVTAAGAQFDARQSGPDDDDLDVSWNAVWESNFLIDDEGWVIELKIPFSALRFPPENANDWGINFIRMVQRNREQSSWCYIDNKLQGINNQLGIMSGITGVKPPMRLSVTPYAAGYINKYSENNKPGYSLKGGVDLKYGISESYTLDMMLIPDFGQVQSDDEVLNLTPFETFYDEQRSFFNEGGDLFSRAEIFYSRRIGAAPLFSEDAENSLTNSEKIKSIPSETQIVNATKITGKSRNGLSLGFLNAMTSQCYATVTDTLLGSEHQQKIQPFTNYNVSVFEKSLKNNSFISLINTNMLMNDREFGADVLGSEIKLYNKENSYGIFAKGAISHNWNNGIAKNGGYYDIDLAKTKGKFQLEATQKFFSQNYDPNLLGYNYLNNIFKNRVQLEYNITDPFWRILWWKNAFATKLLHYTDPFQFSQLEVSASSHLTFRNHLTLGLQGLVSPKSFDFFEPRTMGRYFQRPSFGYMDVMISSDYSKKFALDIQPAFAFAKNVNFSMFEFEISPRYRPSDHILLVIETNTSLEKNDRGFVSKSENKDTIFFSRRNINTLENTFRFSYAFNNKASLSFRLRHYISKLDHIEFSTLMDNGKLSVSPDFSSADLTFSAFNIDMIYTWNFAPGSEISLVWKNAIENDEDFLLSGYMNNFKQTLESPQLNSISIKLLYYLDYHSLKKKQTDS